MTNQGRAQLHHGQKRKWGPKNKAIALPPLRCLKDFIMETASNIKVGWNQVKPKPQVYATRLPVKQADAHCTPKKRTGSWKLRVKMLV